MRIHKALLFLIILLPTGCITSVIQHKEYSGLRYIQRPLIADELSGKYRFVPKPNEVRRLGLASNDTVYLEIKTDTAGNTAEGLSGTYWVSKMILAYLNDTKEPYSNRWKMEGGSRIYFLQHKPTPNAARFFVQQRVQSDTLHLVGYFGDYDSKNVYRIVDFKKIN